MDEQEENLLGKTRLSSTDPKFGAEPAEMYGTLTTTSLVDSTAQKMDEASGLYIGKIPTVTGRWSLYYEKLAEAIQTGGQPTVKPEEARDVIRVIELARESHLKGQSVVWS